jgi:hypothetical protein
MGSLLPIAVVAEAAQWFGRALYNLAAILDTRVFVIGGSVWNHHGDWLLPLVQPEIERRLPALTQGVSIVPAALGAVVADVGALSLVMPPDWMPQWRNTQPLGFADRRRVIKRLKSSNKMMCHSEECNDEESQSHVPSLTVEIPAGAHVKAGKPLRFRRRIACEGRGVLPCKTIPLRRRGKGVLPCKAIPLRRREAVPRETPAPPCATKPLLHPLLHLRSE